MEIKEEKRIMCLGCECGCEVSIGFRDGKPVCLGGNNCPTGESFAMSLIGLQSGDIPQKQGGKEPNGK